jgi:hypothetical protein
MEFGKIWIQNVGIIDFQVISAAENSNKFQKTRFWKEISVEDVVTLGPTAQATLVSSSSFAQELEVQLSYVPNQSEKLRKIGN